MAGGLAQVFKLQQEFGEEEQDDNGCPINPPEESFHEAEEEVGGGLFLNLAWIFDGKEWKDLEPMSVARDQLACSLVEMDDGEVLHLIQGLKSQTIKHGLSLITKFTIVILPIL